MASDEMVGRYRLVRPLAQGGMAEVFLAKHEGLEGFSKYVTVKRVLSQFSSDADFVQMFLDEARLAAQLSHPNVVQVFDFGQHAETYYLAMEFLNGEDLSSILRALRERREYVPFPVAAAIIAEAASGLHYAHTLHDEEGRPLHIVHRDVSPSNLFLTYQGNVKVLDFGIAKAEGKALKTKTGILKGKHIYMSPEQIEGDSLTGQSDLFALGAVLYELLTFVRPFQRENEIAVLRAILDGEIARPSTHRAGIPEALEDVCMRCLERDLKRRYQTGEQLARALREVMGSLSGPDTIRTWLTQLFGEGAEKRKLDALREPTSPSSKVDADATKRLDSGPLSVEMMTAATLAPTSPPKRTLAVGVALGLVTACAIAAGAYAVVAGGDEEAAVAKAIAAPADLPAPTGAEVKPDEKAAAEATPQTSPQLAAAAGSTPPAEADDDEKPAAESEKKATKKQAKKQAKKRTRRQGARATKRDPPPSEPEPAPRKVEERPTAAAEKGALTVNCIPWCRIYVDGKDTGKNSPLMGLALPAGKHRLRVVNPPTGQSEERDVVIKPGETTRSIIRF